MPCCKKLLKVLLLLTLPVWLCATAVRADGIEVNKAEIHASEDGYQLSADFNVNLNNVVQQALSLGVPLYFVGEFTLTRSRWYWLDEQVYQNEHSVKLSYNVLTRQYRISRGSLFQNFASLEDMMRILARQNSGYIPVDAMKKDGNYIASVRLRLDTKQLPKLMQVNVLTSRDWDFDSGWYRWLIRSQDAALRGKTESQ
ncbi:MAG TPA: DUF4390 domain-containing protein [Gallionella sp.]|nr:MAG: hypothetical protein A2Z87_11065 [Gallionellales bacterium GWA2_54_124]OGT17598.1 MAG: hypothetical protein A2522_10255 [Gallionellales bacterium RIFOXYD12_FULL_53_10]OGT26514.1 MAG: hypothetical protein A3K00_06345 [Gallionellales bacterium RIFOXYD2_FULL_52_7]HCI54106.1 DUF4390 domain-containing protein [Gallionella sp.]